MTVSPNATNLAPPAETITHRGVNLNGIPFEMRQEPRWGVWRFEEREGKRTKVPYSAVTGNRASSTNLADWTTFDLAADFLLHRREYDGLGFCLGDGWAGIDMDKCRNPETGELTPWALSLVAKLDSYTEISPSKTGLKVFVHSSATSLPRNRRKGFDSYDGAKLGEIEIYVNGRYFTVTGERSMAAEIRNVDDVLDEIVNEYLQPAAPAVPLASIHSLGVADEDVIRIIRKSKQASKFDALWHGDTGACGGDDSAADLALCGVLAFYCDSPDQVDRIFRNSGLFREKWDERRGDTTYGRMTVDKAWNEQTDHLKPRSSGRNSTHGNSHTSSPSSSSSPETESGASNSQGKEANYSEFWAARPELTRLHDYALAHRASPWAVLGCVLARVVAATPPNIVLPAFIGDVASVNIFIGLVGPSGGGKNVAESTARSFVRIADQTFAEHQLGSGQGLAHAYAHREFKRGEPSRVVRDASAALFTLGEVDMLRGLFDQQGSTLMPALRNLAMGEHLGHFYVDPEKRIEIPAHSYRASLIVGIQPERAGVLLDDEAGGTPQRFLWLPTTHPHPDDKPDEPLVLDWQLPRIGTSELYPVPVCTTAVREIDAAFLARARGESDALDGHLMLTREKAALGLGLLAGHAEITAEDWQLSNAFIEVSATTRASVVDALVAVREREDAARTQRRVKQERAIDDDSTARAFAAAQRQAVAHVAKDACGGCKKRCIRNAIAGKYRVGLSIDEVLADALARDYLTVSGDGTTYTTGGRTP